MTIKRQYILVLDSGIALQPVDTVKQVEEQLERVTEPFVYAEMKTVYVKTAEGGEPAHG